MPGLDHLQKVDSDVLDDLWLQVVAVVIGARVSVINNTFRSIITPVVLPCTAFTLFRCLRRIRGNSYSTGSQEKTKNE